MPDVDISLGPVQALVRFWLRFIVFSFRIMPACFVLLLPIVIIHDRISPWPAALSTLSQYRGQFRICVGGGSHTEDTAEGRSSTVSRSYILLPMVFSEQSVYNVVSTNGASPTIEQDQSGFWIQSIMYLGFLLILIYQIRTRIRSREANEMYLPDKQAGTQQLTRPEFK